MQRVLVNGMQESEVDSRLPWGVAHMTQGQKLSGRCEILLSSAGLMHSDVRVRACHTSFSCASSFHSH